MIYDDAIDVCLKMLINRLSVEYEAGNHDQAARLAGAIDSLMKYYANFGTRNHADRLTSNN